MGMVQQAMVPLMVPLYQATGNYGPNRKIEHGGKEYTLFAGKESPLSNYAPFRFEGKDFTSSEQCYAYQKAMFAKDVARAKKILQAEDPIAIKKAKHPNRNPR